MGNIFYVDGKFVDSAAAQVPADDLAVLRGYGIFDFTRTYGGRPFRLDDHLQRLQRSAELILLELPHSLDDIRDVALETLARNGYPGNGADARLRIVVTGGSSPDDITPAGPARLLMLVTPFAAQPAARYREGIKIISDRQERYLPEAKTINYVPAIVALRRARQAGAVEAIYVNRAGHALEGTTTNLFAVFGDRLVTPVNGDPLWRHASGRAGAGRRGACLWSSASCRWRSCCAQMKFLSLRRARKSAPSARWMTRASARARPARTPAP